jgi:hypothetical protein
MSCRANRLAGVPNNEVLLVSHTDAGWLPDGGRADVVLAGTDAALPRPTCVVRLLATRDGKVLAVPRADGKGLDIPALSVRPSEVDDCLQALIVRVLGGVHPTMLLAYVRNVVTGAPDDYPWPSPDAHFAVWYCAVPADCESRACGSMHPKRRPSCAVGTGGRSLPTCSDDQSDGRTSGHAAVSTVRRVRRRVSH